MSRQYHIELAYGYEIGECGTYHAFNAYDPETPIPDNVKQELSSMLDVDPNEDNFDWDTMYVALPESLIQRIKSDAIAEFQSASNGLQANHTGGQQ